MKTPPTILVLEDERPQLLAVRAALRGLGAIREFSDPAPAMEFLKRDTADAAIVDIHMPHFETDGMDFIRSVRAFDHDLCVIIRTGDDSTALADDAIEVRAFRRAIKGATSIAELRRLTAAAIMETRTRRQITNDAANTIAVKTQWARALGSIEDVFSVSTGYQGLLHDLRTRLTAIAGTAEILSEALAHNRTNILQEFVGKNRQLVGDLLGEIDAFLDSPFATAKPQPHAADRVTANGVIECLRRHFLSSSAWLADRKTVSATGLSDDMYVSAAPLNLLTAIRHLVEFCVERSTSGSTTRLSASYCDDAAKAIAAIPEPSLIFTERPVGSSTICVVFQVCSALGAMTLDQVRRCFDEYPDDPHSGNLQMIPLVLHADLTAIAVSGTATGLIVFELFLPVYR